MIAWLTLRVGCGMVVRIPGKDFVRRKVMDVLDSLMAESQPPAHPTWPSGAAKGITKVKYTHDAMIDIIITNPSISQNDLALNFGYSASWVSQIISSDAFQARLAERTGELVDPTIRATVEEQFKGLVLRSLDILRDKLNRPSKDIPDLLALRSLEIASRAAGYGAKPEVVPQSPVNVNLYLEGLAGNLTSLLRREKAKVIEHNPIEDDS